MLEYSVYYKHTFFKTPSNDIIVYWVWFIGIVKSFEEFQRGNLSQAHLKIVLQKTVYLLDEHQVRIYYETFK